MKSELKMIQVTSHPHIVPVIELLQDKQSIAIASEICKGGDLYNRLQKVSRFSEKETAYMIMQLLKALNYLHKINIVHRDLKP